MSFATELRKLSLMTLLEFQCVTYAEIISFNEDTYTADIKILKQRLIGANLMLHPQAYNIPIVIQSGGGYSIRGTYAKGDIVAVAYAVSEIDTKGEVTNDNSKFLSRDNAVILGGLVSESPSTDGKLYIGSELSNIQLKDTEIKLTVGITTFTINAAGATVSVGGITVNLFTHKHGTGVGPSSNPIPGT